MERKLFLLSIGLLPLLLLSCATKVSAIDKMLYVCKDMHNKSNDAYYFTDRFGHKISSSRFSEARQFAPNGLAAVCEPGIGGYKWGYVNKSMDLVIPYQYDFASDFGAFGFDDSLACVKFGLDDYSRWQNPALSFGPTMLIDEKGRQASRVYSFMLLNTSSSHNHITVVNDGFDFYGTKGYHTYSSDGYWGAIDCRGNEVIACIYDFFIPFSSLGIYIVRLKGKWGAIGYDGMELIPCVYDGAFYSSGVDSFNTFKEINGEDSCQWDECSDREHFCFVKDGRIAMRLKLSVN